MQGQQQGACIQYHSSEQWKQPGRGAEPNDDKSLQLASWEQQKHQTAEQQEKAAGQCEGVCLREDQNQREK